MNRDQRKQLARDKRRIQREKRTRLEKEINDLDIEVEKELDIPEEVQKDYMGSAAACSFSELDAEMISQQRVEKVNETTNMVRDMVNNILWRSEFSPQEKASAIKSVADEFGSRVRSIMESPMEKEATADIDTLVLEATLAREKRNISSTKGVKGLVAKTIHASAKVLGIQLPDENDASAVQIEKDANGDWRSVMWTSNNFIDRDGDIISEDAHKEYVEWVNKEENKDCMPAFVTWHIPGTARENPVDYVDYFNGFLVTSAKLTDIEAVGLLKATKKTNIGMSHGSFVLERDAKDPRVINKYRMYEVSDLPLDKAANPFTAIETVSKEVEMDKKEYLAELLGEEKAEAFLAKTGLKQKSLQDAEIESKEADTAPVVEPVVEPVIEVPVVTEPIVKEEKPEDVVAKVLKELDIEGLNEFVTKAQEAMAKIPVLESLVKELSTSNDEKLAEMIDPPVSRKLAWTRPSESEKNIAKESDALVESKPGIPKGYWLSEITGTSPIQEKV
jgi:hypothetical protein